MHVSDKKFFPKKKILSISLVTYVFNIFLYFSHIKRYKNVNQIFLNTNILSYKHVF